MLLYIEAGIVTASDIFMGLLIIITWRRRPNPDFSQSAPYVTIFVFVT